jgi:hypothetical protein
VVMSPNSENIELLRTEEFWFGKKGRWYLCLQDGDYVQSSHSLCLPDDLDIGHLEQCLLIDTS